MEILKNDSADPARALLVDPKLADSSKQDLLDGRILVDFRSSGESWPLQVEDRSKGCTLDPALANPGLGTGIVEALAQQLHATVTIAAAHPGTTRAVRARTGRQRAISRRNGNFEPARELMLGHFGISAVHAGAVRAARTKP